MAAGEIIQGVRWLRDAAGRLVGYRNPVTDKDEDLNAAAVQSLVSADGNLASADVATTTGTPGEVRRISDGDNKGAIVTWAIPQGASAYTWCWWLWPQAAY